MNKMYMCSVIHCVCTPPFPTTSRLHAFLSFSYLKLFFYFIFFGRNHLGIKSEKRQLIFESWTWEMLVMKRAHWNTSEVIETYAIFYLDMLQILINFLVCTSNKLFTTVIYSTINITYDNKRNVVIKYEAKKPGRFIAPRDSILWNSRGKNATVLLLPYYLNGTKCRVDR